MLHKPVLLNEVNSSLIVKEGDIVVDCTFGCGGHTAMFLKSLNNKGLVIGIDRDPSVLKLSDKVFKQDIETNRLNLVNESFSNLGKILLDMKVTGNISVILADLGFSSFQMDNAERGFSFLKDGPLDMRMNNDKGCTAADILNFKNEEELSSIFREYGEEERAKYIAKKIVEYRKNKKFETTKELADLICDHSPGMRNRYRKNPATKVFQALRIEVNQELKELEALLPVAFGALKRGGRLGIISFHSLEDRLVKRTFLNWEKPSGRIKIPKKMPIKEKQIEELYPSVGKIIKPFPMKPNQDEVETNPRARSARLRVIEKL